MSEKVNLGEICDILNGYAFKSKLYVEKGIRIIRITNVQKGIIEDLDPKYYDVSQINNLRNYILKENDLLISLTGNVGRVALMKESFLPAALNQRVGCLRIKDENNVSIRYLYQYLNSNKFENDCINNSNGIAQKNLSTEWLKDYMIAIPDINIQNKVANILEKIQKIIELKKHQIHYFEDLIKSQFVEMFGNIQEYKRLEEYSTLITKGASPKWQGIDYKSNGTLFVTSENVREGYIDISKPKYLDNKINEILPRSVLKKDDILINIVGASIGRAGKYDYDYVANINQAVALVRTKNINNVFLLQYLNSEQAIKMYNDMKKGGARENLSLKNISDLKIPKAPIELQNKFAEFVKQVDKQKFEIQKNLEKTQKLQQSLMNKYFN